MPTSARSRRSYEPVTDTDLQRLAALGEAHHATFRAAHPDWAKDFLAVCLAQGAARHRTQGGTGVKDFDVWLFYSLPVGRNGGRFPWNRYVAHVDFGPSAHGRPEHTEEERANPAYDVAGWERFAGRRVDLMVRAIPPHADGPVAAVRAWVARGAKVRPSPDGGAPSAWWLAQAPILTLSKDRFGSVIWDPATDRAGLGCASGRA
jgi:hypothetical protein